MRGCLSCLTAVLAFASGMAGVRARAEDSIAVVYVKGLESSEEYKVMPESEYLVLKRRAMEEARLMQAAMDAARKEWNGEQRELTRKSREDYVRQQADRRNDPHRNTPRAAATVVKRKPFPDLDLDLKPEVRCVGIFRSNEMARAEAMAEELRNALQRKSRAAGSGGVSFGGMSRSSSVSLNAKMPSRLSGGSARAYDPSRFGSKKRGVDEGDRKKAEELFGKHLARLKSEDGDTGIPTGLRRPDSTPGGGKRLGEGITPSFKKP